MQKLGTFQTVSLIVDCQPRGCRFVVVLEVSSCLCFSVNWRTVSQSCLCSVIRFITTGDCLEVPLRTGDCASHCYGQIWRARSLQKKEDFQLKQNGELQTIANFE